MSTDSNVEAVRAALLQRSAAGVAKYGTTTERLDLDLPEWLTHAQEEAMDFAVYLERIKKDVAALLVDQGAGFIDAKCLDWLEAFIIAKPDAEISVEPYRVPIWEISAEGRLIGGGATLRKALIHAAIGNRQS